MTAQNSNLESLAATVQDKFGTNDASKLALQSFHAESAALLGKSSPEIFGATSVNSNFKEMVNKICGPFAVVDGSHGGQQQDADVDVRAKEKV